MKAHTKAALVGALIASTAFVTVPALLPQDARAQDPVKIVPVPASEQYKFLSLAPFQNDSSTKRMDDTLNALAADGWKVRTGVGVGLILAR